MTTQERLESIVRDIELIEDGDLRQLLDENYDAFDKLQNLLNNAKYEAETLVDDQIDKAKQNAD